MTARRGPSRACSNPARPATATSRAAPTAASSASTQGAAARLRRDDAEAWPVPRVLDPGAAGYSDLAVGADGSIFCLYEGRARQGDRLLEPHLTIARSGGAGLHGA